MNVISDSPILAGGKTPEVDKGAVGEADLHAVGPLGVVSGHQEVTPPCDGAKVQPPSLMNQYLLSADAQFRARLSENSDTDNSPFLRTIGGWLRQAVETGEIKISPSENEEDDRPASGPIP